MHLKEIPLRYTEWLHSLFFYALPYSDDFSTDFSKSLGLDLDTLT